MSTKVTVTAPVEISAETLAYVIEGAAFGYWGEYAEYEEAAEILSGEAVAIIAEEGEEFGDKPIKHRLDLAAIQRGLVAMAYEYPRHFADILSGDFDSITGDVLIQLAVLADIKYG